MGKKQRRKKHSNKKKKKSTPKLPFRVTKIFDDPTGGLVNMRLNLAMMNLAKYTDLDENEKTDLFRLLVLISRKSVSVWRHYQAYIKAEDELIKSAKKKKHVDVLSQDLFIEFDEFLVQTKSTLDYLVKVPRIIFGEKAWSLRTFGNKGDDVIKMLENNIPDRFKKNAKGVAVILKGHQDWLRSIVEARDRINHYIDGGIDIEFFAVVRDDNGKIHVPRFASDQTVREALKASWEYLFQLCEDFLGLVIAFRTKKGFAFFHGRRDMSSHDSVWAIITQETMETIVSEEGWTAIGDV